MAYVCVLGNDSSCFLEVSDRLLKSCNVHTCGWFVYWHVLVVHSQGCLLTFLHFVMSCQLGLFHLHACMKLFIYMIITLYIKLVIL